MMLRRSLILIGLIAMCAKPGALHTACTSYKICVCSLNTHRECIADCSFKNLSSVPTQLPPVTIRLILRSNILAVLKPYSFSNLPYLRDLDLSYNRIFKIEKNAFFGLSQLDNLNLEHNRLQLHPSVYTADVFLGLSQLKTLRINGNSDTVNKSYTYPDQALSGLQFLQTLHMDGLPNEIFGFHFRKLKRLVNLSLSGFDGNCHIGNVLNDTFLYLNTIQHLNLSKCRVREIESQTFFSLVRLHTLDLSDNEQFGTNIHQNTWYSLQNSSLKVLMLNRIWDRLFPWFVVKNKHVKYLSTTSLQKLYVDDNGIAIAEVGVLSQFRDSLEFISVRRNIIMPSYYFFEFGKFKAIKEVDVRDQFPNLAVAFGKSPLGHCQTSFHSELLQQIPNPCLTSHDCVMEERSISAYKLPLFRVPSNLEIIHAQNIKTNFYSLTFVIAYENNIKIIDLSRNIFPYFRGPILGMTYLSHLDLSFTSAKYVSDKCFVNLLALQVLNISGNYLGNNFQRDKDGRILRNLPNLTVLDISQNRIESLPYCVFCNLKSVRHINLSRNHLKTLDIKLKHLNHLSSIDVSQNRLRFLSIKVQSALDDLGNVTIDLSHNPIDCSCENIPFLKWLVSTKIVFENKQNYECLFPDLSTQSLKNFKNTLSVVKRKCATMWPLLIGITCGLILCLITTVAGIGYRYRWKLRYLYYIVRNKYHQTKNTDNENFKFEAFLSYDTEDSIVITEGILPNIEIKESMKLCIHQRDFIPGQPIASNIINAVHNSKKTVMILSRNFLESEWCMYEMQMARMENMHTGRNNIIVVMYENIPAKELPLEILYEIQDHSYLEYPYKEEDLECFWQRLAHAINAD